MASSNLRTGRQTEEKSCEVSNEHTSSHGKQWGHGKIVFDRVICRSRMTHSTPRQPAVPTSWLFPAKREVQRPAMLGVLVEETQRWSQNTMNHEFVEQYCSMTPSESGRQTWFSFPRNEAPSSVTGCAYAPVFTVEGINFVFSSIFVLFNLFHALDALLTCFAFRSMILSYFSSHLHIKTNLYRMHSFSSSAKLTRSRRSPRYFGRMLPPWRNLLNTVFWGLLLMLFRILRC